ncbi:hypothetical protein BJN34_08120 [Cupriavidus necator]|uniref:Uncharacterized protein n=1 Tax=Cupriavidus necator TaxID=106590 RepID=A0A1U9UM50_CUPNE|nr:hypothetical protein [Cupriavidus necator]AQV93856.1 hypothetical protein BJN34_08120 [Cupriavidus necator]
MAIKKITDRRGMMARLSAPNETVSRNYLREAVLLCETHLAGLPDVSKPYVGGHFVWRDRAHYYVAGRGRGGGSRLVEVFVIDASENLEPLHAFQYPPPLAALFPADYGVLHEDGEGQAVPMAMLGPTAGIQQ